MSKPDKETRLNTARVRNAFDKQALRRICLMAEDDFPTVYGLDKTDTGTGWFGESNFYAHRDNGSDVLAVAHLDTVVAAERRKVEFFNTGYGPLIKSGSLDDRLGAYTILELLPKLGIKHDVLLTTGEEYGDSTAQFFQTEKQYHYLIEFDRGPRDVVMYCYETPETCAAVRVSGAPVGHGSFSDIAYLEQLGAKGFNWSVAYNDYHSERGFAYLNEYFRMIGHYLKFHELFGDLMMPHTPAPKPVYRTRYGRYPEEGTGYFSGSRAVTGLVSTGLGESAVDVGLEECPICSKPGDRTLRVCFGCEICLLCGEWLEDCEHWSFGSGSKEERTAG